MNNKVTFIFCLSLLSCATFKPNGDSGINLNAPSGNLEQSIFAVSGIGDQGDNSTALLTILKKQLAEVGDRGKLLMLGNFGLKSGFPDSSHLINQQRYNTALNATTDLVASHSGESYLIPGLNEWSNGRKRGLGRLRSLQAYLSTTFDREDILLPGNGCPGPIEIELNDNTVLLVIDTQWWFQVQEDNEESGCEIRGKGDFLVSLDDAVKRNYDKQIIVAGFHPLYSNGPSSGYYPASKHLLPPVIGTLHSFYKRRIGDVQDISNFGYIIFRTIIRRTLSAHPNAIYLSAKERSLQYFERNQVHMIISGSVAKPTAVSGKEGPMFAHGRSGFTRINQYTNGEVWLEFWGMDSQGKEELVYRSKLYQWVAPEKPELITGLDFTGQTKTAFTTKKHHKKKNKKGFTGVNYRAEWEAEISGIPVFDIGKEKGGLTILKKGGGLQTRSLRMEDKTGKQWVLRSVEKFAAKALPLALRGTYVEDYVSDQVSASHPYGALVVPPMAEAVNVYHTNPRLMYLPDDPRLGIYQSDFKEGLYIFEERPANETWQEADFFGKPDDIINSLKLIDKMKKDGSHHVDQSQTVRSRLFDIVIGDWDRHDDQWRWAKYNKAEKYGEKIDLYRPIPRDRDQAFFLGDGALLKLGSHKWGQPKFQGFKNEIRDVEGLAFNARYFDRFFYTEADLNVWLEQAEFIKKNLTDEVIESAIKSWPPEIYELNGEAIISKLRERRDDLTNYATKLYGFFSKNVNVLGSEKADRFVVERLDGGQTKVTIYRVFKKKREMKGKYYERTFDSEVTKEIRLYALGGIDEIEITGEVKEGIKIRVIGGGGKDTVDDKSKVSGISKKTVVYDNLTGTEISRSSETKVRISDNEETINNYNRREFKYDILSPKFFGGLNPDDFILIGGGFSFVKQGFRKEPFKSRHTFLFDIATKSSSFNFKLINEYNQVFGKWDFTNTLDVSEPSFADFFYGYGNGTEVDEDLRENDSQFYRARYSVIKIAPALRRRWNDDKHILEIGGFFERINVETEDNDTEGPTRFIFQYDSIRQAQGFDLLDEARNYGGGFLNYSFDNTNSKVVPTRGFRYNFKSILRSQIGDESTLNHGQFSSNLSFYFTIGKSDRVTLAARIGGIATTGDFEFYHAARLGGLSNLRGHRRLRFAGDNAVYQNNEIRIKLFDMRNKLFVGPVGINLIADVGKIWADGLPNEIGRSDWHSSVGGGIWIAPFQSLVINLDYTKSLSLSDESGVPFVRFGFFF